MNESLVELRNHPYFQKIRNDKSENKVAAANQDTRTSSTSSFEIKNIEDTKKDKSVNDKKDLHKDVLHDSIA